MEAVQDLNIRETSPLAPPRQLRAEMPPDAIALDTVVEGRVEVERILSMVDSVLLLVDAVDGPMPQTRFVTQKAFSHGLHPIVVINKLDRDAARPDWVLDETFELFDRLGATDEQLDFPVVYTSAINGTATLDTDARGTDMTPLFQTIVDSVPPPDVAPDGPLQLQISSLDYSSYLTDPPLLHISPQA